MSENPILVIDNYDSFVYNLVYLLREAGHEVHVVRNDKITLPEVAAYDKILLSPGPGIPAEAGIMPQIIEQYAPFKSILGVCLGHQAIGEAFGGTLENMSDVYHGVAHQISITPDEKLFKTLPDSLKVCRYHSWTVSPENFPHDQLRITATDPDGRVMALAHQRYDVRGVQFHPESILTEHGKQMINNWLSVK